MTINDATGDQNREDPGAGLYSREIAAHDHAGAPERDLIQYLVELVIESWWDLDTRAGAGFHTYFTEDGVFDFAGQRREGRAGIAANIQDRARNGDRSTVHLLSNFTGQRTGEDTATVRSYISVYGRDGLPPLSSKIPNLIGFMQDQFQRQTDGRWLIRSRIFRPVLFDPADRVAARIG